jgi:hypothetical protein
MYVCMFREIILILREAAPSKEFGLWLIFPGVGETMIEQC